MHGNSGLNAGLVKQYSFDEGKGGSPSSSANWPRQFSFNSLKRLNGGADDGQSGASGAAVAVELHRAKAVPNSNPSGYGEDGVSAIPGDTPISIDAKHAVRTRSLSGNAKSASDDDALSAAPAPGDRARSADSTQRRHRPRHHDNTRYCNDGDSGDPDTGNGEANGGISHDVYHANDGNQSSSSTRSAARRRYGSIEMHPRYIPLDFHFGTTADIVDGKCGAVWPVWPY